MQSFSQQRQLVGGWQFNLARPRTLDILRLIIYLGVLSFGHQRRIQDAIHGVSGAIVVQRVEGEVKKKISRDKLYTLRDQSNLHRISFI